MAEEPAAIEWAYILPGISYTFVRIRLFPLQLSLHQVNADFRTRPRR